MIASSDPKRRFEELYDANRLDVLAYCTRRVRPDEAADACSETFLVAWRRIEDVPAPPKTLPYLYGVAAHVIANQRRSFRRRARLHERLQALGVTPQDDPGFVCIQDERDREVIDALHRLKPEDREIVMLYAWEDLPRDTIAEMTGLTRAAIDQRITRAYRRLGELLSPSATGSVVTPRIVESGGT